ncbi:MarR family transcriptional regulator [Haloactinopolyspora alba]|uniref:MarR family transcriptional regulator n=1 Tax=Haloactinopolyspora alba TaxID=648780 RepID=A0A2P8DYX6_9ACTN|nr:MarR family transcriptional regulator [Haloactinopolyspora alba]PSL02410.1 MarR family transcriptional regulator [Haloactinopolyspora alba]
MSDSGDPGVRWLSPDEQRAWQDYRQLKRLLDAQLARDLVRDTGLSEADYDALSTLTEVDGQRWRASELAARLEWSTSRLAHHIGRMERRGLVARENCDTDGRGAMITLTEEGLQTIRRAAPAHVASVRHHFVDRLTPEQLEQLSDIARSVVDHLPTPRT